MLLSSQKRNEEMRWKRMNTLYLKAEMIKAGLTQKELAEKIGMSQNSMSRKLLGKREFTVNEIERVVKVLNLDDRDLIRAIFF